MSRIEAKLNLGSLASGFSFSGRLEVPQVARAIVDGNLGTPAPRMLVSIDSSDPAGVVGAHRHVSKIVETRDVAKIAQSIVAPIAIDVIEIMGRPCAMIDGPGHTMRSHENVIHAPDTVSFRRCSEGLLARKFCIPRATSFRRWSLCSAHRFFCSWKPKKQPSLWLVSEHFRKVIGRKVFDCFHVILLQNPRNFVKC